MTRRPVLPGAAELFRRTDVSAQQPAPVTELATLAAAQASPALRPRPGAGAPPAGESTPAQPLSLVPAGRAGELASLRTQLPVTSPRRRGQSEGSRTRHDEKITVYCSAEELLALEGARLTLRGQHGVVADRGRIVREAIAVLLADLDENGEDSILVQRLQK
ncbi:MAG TPA: hypothetical protein VGO95_07295 [Modestobacter sp.]|nr:hypothetical protein [Modestobacter sp.]